MKSMLAIIAVLAAVAALAGCYAYPYPYPYAAPASGPPVFDRSWSAAGNALRDEGVQIHREDRATGMIEGDRGGTPVRARVFTQADGRVRVEFNTPDPGLADRISRAYEYRMGR